MYISHLTIWYLFRFYNTSPSLFFCCGREKWRYLFCHSSKVQNELRILWPHQPESELQQVVHRRMDLCWWTMIIYSLHNKVMNDVKQYIVQPSRPQKDLQSIKKLVLHNSRWLILCNFTSKYWEKKEYWIGKELMSYCINQSFLA